MNRQFKDQVWKASYRPLAEYAEFDDRLRSKMGLQNRYESARIALGYSLALSTPPQPLSAGTLFGKGIAGEHLFGEEIDLWICVFLLDGGLGVSARFDDFRDLVEAHWSRGLQLLKEDFEQCNEDETKLLRKISSDYLPEEGEECLSQKGFSSMHAGELRLKVGPISRTYPGGEAVEFILNAQGTSPHIALMGKTSSGKTTTAVHIAKQIVDETNIPMLMIDPKGEFVEGNKLVGRLENLNATVGVIEVGIEPIPLDFLPDPSVGSVSVQNAAMQLRDSIVLCCKGAGNLQQDLLRTAIEHVILHARPRDLSAIKEQYRYELECQSGKRHDSIMSRLNELTSLKCFAPTMNTEEFFSRSWVLSLRSLGSEELKRLVVLLMLDAVKSYILSQADAPIINGTRALRHFLLIDEARRILSERKYQSLADLVRQGRSKGSAIMLISQDPSDFDGQADDFTTQLGSVIAFACSQTQSGLRALQGVYGRKVQPNEFIDTYLPTGVAFVKLPGRLAERVTCWSHESVERATPPA